MLGVSYIVLSIIMVGILIMGYYISYLKFYKDKKIVTQKIIRVVLFFLVVFLYAGVLSHFEILYDFSLPPRFVFLLLIPFISFCVYYYRKNKNNHFIHSIPLHWTVFYQSFRIVVEFLLLYTFYKGIIPVQATFEGLNFDVVIGITGLILGFVVMKSEGKMKKFLYFWNILGIAMILFVVFIIGTSTYFPKLWGAESPLVQKDFFVFPYLLIATFLAPSAIFIHIVSLIQLNKK